MPNFMMPAPEVAPDGVLGPGIKSATLTRMRCIGATGEVKLRHFRPDATGVTDILDIEAPSPEELLSAPVIAGNTVWGGLYKDHFGHMASEGVHRLWAIALRPELADATVAFQVSRMSDQTVPSWFEQMVARFGISPPRLRFVNRPTRFERLHVPAQGRTLGGKEVVPGYGSLLPILPITILGHTVLPARLYVSRGAHLHSGSYLGESLI